MPNLKDIPQRGALFPVVGGNVQPTSQQPCNCNEAFEDLTTWMAGKRDLSTRVGLQFEFRLQISESVSDQCSFSPLRYQNLPQVSAKLHVTGGHLTTHQPRGRGPLSATQVSGKQINGHPYSY